MKASGKVILVTGGGNGIGRQIVLTLLQRGARVAAVDINSTALEETQSLAADNADRLSLHTCNIADEAAVGELAAAVREVHGHVDGIINNAGIIQPFVNVIDLDMATIRRVVDVNLFGVLNVTKTFLPHLAKRPEAHIVNLSSMGGFFPFPGQVLYGATKAAVKLLSEGLYAELSDTRVGVSVVFPGAIITDIAANSGVKLTDKMLSAQGSFKGTPPDAAARQIVDGMERNQLYVYVGIDSKIMNVLYRLNPKGASAMISKLMKKVL